MTMLLTGITMIAFAGIYAALFTMLGNSARLMATALTGRAPQAAGGAALADSRRFSRA